MTNDPRMKDYYPFGTPDKDSKIHFYDFMLRDATTLPEPMVHPALAVDGPGTSARARGVEHIKPEREQSPDIMKNLYESGVDPLVVGEDVFLKNGEIVAVSDMAFEVLEGTGIVSDGVVRVPSNNSDGDAGVVGEKFSMRSDLLDAFNESNDISVPDNLWAEEESGFGLQSFSEARNEMSQDNGAQNNQPQNMQPQNMQPQNPQPQNTQFQNMQPQNVQSQNVQPQNVQPQNMQPQKPFSNQRENLTPAQQQLMDLYDKFNEAFPNFPTMLAKEAMGFDDEMKYSMGLAKEVERERMRRDSRSIVDKEEKQARIDETGIDYDNQPQMKSMKQMFENPSPRTPYIVDKMLRQKGTNILPSPPKVGKSTFMSYLASQIVTQHPVFNKLEVFPKENGEDWKIGFLDFENDDDYLMDMMKRRLCDSQYTNEERERILNNCVYRLDNDAFTYTDVMDDEMLEKMAKFYDSQGVDILVVDTLRTLIDDAGLKETNEGGLVISRLNKLQALCENMRAIIVLHHTTKGTDRVVRGDGQIEGGAQAVWFIERAEETEDCPAISPEGKWANIFGDDIILGMKGRGVLQEDLRLSFNPQILDYAWIPSEGEAVEMSVGDVEKLVFVIKQMDVLLANKDLLGYDVDGVVKSHLVKVCASAADRSAGLSWPKSQVASFIDDLVAGGVFVAEESSHGVVLNFDLNRSVVRRVLGLDGRLFDVEMDAYLPSVGFEVPKALYGEAFSAVFASVSVSRDVAALDRSYLFEVKLQEWLVSGDPVLVDWAKDVLGEGSGPEGPDDDTDDPDDPDGGSDGPDNDSDDDPTYDSGEVIEHDSVEPESDLEPDGVGSSSQDDERMSGDAGVEDSVEDNDAGYHDDVSWPELNNNTDASPPNEPSTVDGQSKVYSSHDPFNTKLTPIQPNTVFGEPNKKSGPVTQTQRMRGIRTIGSGSDTDPVP